MTHDDSSTSLFITGGYWNPGIIKVHKIMEIDNNAQDLFVARFDWTLNFTTWVKYGRTGGPAITPKKILSYTDMD